MTLNHRVNFQAENLTLKANNTLISSLFFVMSQREKTNRSVDELCRLFFSTAWIELAGYGQNALVYEITTITKTTTNKALVC